MILIAFNFFRLFSFYWCVLFLVIFIFMFTQKLPGADTELSLGGANFRRAKRAVNLMVTINTNLKKNLNIFIEGH